MQAFVTGSTGLLGSNLVQQLVEAGWQVKVLVRSARKAQAVFGDLPIHLVEGDMLNVAAFAAEMRGCDVLFHAAAYFREYFQPGDHWHMLEAINIKGTVQILEAAEQMGVRKAIYVSSSTVIGMKTDGTQADESTPPDAVMTNLYRKSKVLAETAVAEFLKTHQLPVVLVLPTWMWGPRDNAPTNSGRIVQDFLKNRLPAIIPGGAMIVDARDVAQAMIAAVERGKSGERYILGGRYHTLEAVIQLLAKVTGLPAPTRRIPYAFALLYAWVSELQARFLRRETLITPEALRVLQDRTVLSSAKSIRELGAAFRPLEVTLRDEVSWYQVRSKNAVDTLRAASSFQSR